VVGYPVAKDDVLASPPVPGRWQVIGRRDSVEERLTTRRVWLREESTGRPALVLSFAPPGADLDGSLVVGTVLDADLHHYPGAAPLRALVGERRGPAVPLKGLAGASLADAQRALAAAVSADPWISAWPVVVSGVTPVPGGSGWALVAADGRSVPLIAGEPFPWRLVAVSGGGPVTVTGELTHRGLRALAVLDEAAGADALVPL
jgi:hypothetical protein